MKKSNVRINIGVDADGGVTVSAVPEEVKNKIPRPGDSIYVIEPYPVIDPEDVDDEEIFAEDIKLKPVMGYSYNASMVKSSVLNDELTEVLVNGDYRIPLYKGEGNPDKKIMVFTEEEKAIDKFRTLMNISVAEVDRRITLNQNIKANLKESLEKLYH
jgi:hypothetical protein